MAKLDIDRKKAIEKSIKKWAKIVDLMRDEKPHRCGLCEFSEKHLDEKCPLKRKTCDTSECVKGFYNVFSPADKLLTRLEKLRGVK